MTGAREIRLVEDEDGWTAIEVASGLETSAETREAALERLDEAAAVSFERDSLEDEEDRPEALRDIDELEDMELFGR